MIVKDTEEKPEMKSEINKGNDNNKKFIDFENTDITIIGLVIICISIIFFMWLTKQYDFKDILRDIILGMLALATGNKMKWIWW